MKIALIGATGLVGSAVLTELLARGHEVTAIARSSKNLRPHSHVRAVELDVLRDYDALDKALRGHDAVISAYNAGWTNPDYAQDFVRGSQLIQTETKQAGVRRLLVVGGAGSLYVQGVQLVDSPDFPEAFRSAASAARDYLNMLKQEQELDWVFLSPAVSFGNDGPTSRRGNYRIGADEPVFDAEGVSTISPADLAVAIVDEIEKPAHHRQRFTVAY